MSKLLTLKGLAIYFLLPLGGIFLSYAHQEEILDYDYLLVEDSLFAQRYRNEKSALVLLTKIDTGTDLIDLAKKLDFLGGQVLFATYDGYLYQRIRKN